MFMREVNHIGGSRLFILTGVLGLVLLTTTALHAQSPGGISSGLTAWFKANSTTTGNILPNTTHNTAVSEWKSELGGLSVTQGTTSKMPLFIAAASANNNFNFNPSLQFASSQVKGLVNTSPAVDLLGNTGTYFLITNTFREPAVTSSTCFSYTSAATGARYQAKADFRIQTGVSAGFGYIADLDPASTSLNPAAIPPIDYPRTSAIIITSRSAGAEFRARRNADTTALGSGNIYYPAIGSGLGIGFNSPGFGEATSSAMAEVIMYNSNLSDADINKVETYLAIKYGITLGQGTTFTQPIGPTNYSASNGIVIWNAAGNNGYGKCITGIGRDDASALLQKQSKSVHDSTLVYIYNGNTGGTFTAMNTDNTTSFPGDRAFLLFGDNGLSRNLNTCIYNGKMARMDRVWKVQRSGSIGVTTLAVDQTDVPAAVKNLIVSNNPLFPAGNTTIYPLQSAAGKLYAAVTLANNEYFSFASDSLIVQLTVTDPTCSAPNSGSVAAAPTGGINPYTYSWNTSPVQTGATATGLGGGNYILTVTNSGGCAATYPVTVATPPPAPVIAVSASQNAICNGSPVTLTASVVSGTVASWSWSPGGQTTSAITVTPSSTTTYTVTGSDGAGCNTTATTTITVNTVPTSSFTVSPINACAGTTQTVTYTGTASAGASYNWDFAGATVQSGSGAGPYSIVFNTPGNYTIQLQVTENNCPSTTSSQAVIISQPVTASFQATPVTICSGSTVTVNFTGSAGPTATPVWNFGGGIVQSGTGFGPYTILYNSSGAITLTVTDGACSNTAPSQNITVIPSPVAAFTATPVKGCPPLEVSFTNQSQGGDSYQWSFGDGGSDNVANPQYTYTASGTFDVSLTVISQGQCSNTVILADLVQVRPKPVAFFTSTPAENTPLELHLANFQFTNGSQLADTYIWNFGDNSTSSSANPLHQYLFPGNYEVKLYAINDVGCVDSFSREFYMVIPDKDLIIPNAFSPNGDGTNDTWTIDGLRGYPDSKVEVYNRWGQQVFASRGYTTPWDGKYKGSFIPVGTYYYVIRTSLRNYNGWLMVVR
jgi:gliding motility-associated-like protein